MHNLTAEESQIWDVINNDLGAVSIKAEEAKAMNRAIYNSAEGDDLTNSERLNDLLLLIRAQNDILEPLIKGIDLTSEKLADIVLHRDGEPVFTGEEAHQ